MAIHEMKNESLFRGGRLDKEEVRRISAIATRNGWQSYPPPPELSGAVRAPANKKLLNGQVHHHTQPPPMLNCEDFRTTPVPTIPMPTSLQTPEFNEVPSTLDAATLKAEGLSAEYD